MIINYHFFISSISTLPVPLSIFKQFEMLRYPLDAKRIINVTSGKLMNSTPNFKGFAAVFDKTNRKSNSSGTCTKSLETTASPTIVTCFTALPFSSVNLVQLGASIVLLVEIHSILDCESQKECTSLR